MCDLVGKNLQPTTIVTNARVFNTKVLKNVMLALDQGSQKGK